MVQQLILWPQQKEPLNTEGLIIYVHSSRNHSHEKSIRREKGILIVPSIYFLTPAAPHENVLQYYLSTVEPKRYVNTITECCLRQKLLSI